MEGLGLDNLNKLYRVLEPISRCKTYAGVRVFKERQLPF